MRKRRLVSAGIIGFGALFTLGWLFSPAATAQSGAVSGVVVDADGPVAGARVRVRATENATLTGADGTFILSGLAEGEAVEITAWARGYYIAYTQVTPPADNVTLTLRRYHTEDHPEYEWALPEGEAGVGESGGCGQCHPRVVDQWKNNAHGQAVSNPRFFSLYNGTSLDGSQQIAPGYGLDFPGTAGNCAQCHAPGAGVDGYLTVNMNAVRDDAAAGIHCDYCHKIGGMYLNPATQLPYPNAPGAQSQVILRPPEGDNIFIGPYDDIHDPDTYVPEISASAYCAPCHQFSFWGTPIYQSYAEWLDSSYAEDNITCQNCHMPPNGDTMFATVEAGGLEHPPETIPSHLDLGATDVNLLQNTVEMALDARREAAQIVVTVTLTNTGTGHHVPTDFPGRQMILLVGATDASGESLALLDGPTVPEWGGPEAGSPGVVYAKLLRDVATGDMPVVSYWRRSQIASDNRLAAFESATSTYVFALPPSANVTISARLLFRRVFYDVAAARGWDILDILMAETSAQVIVD